MFAQLREFNRFHPIIRFLLFGTMIMRAARSMSVPFLAIYLYRQTGLSSDLIGIIIGLGFLASTIGGIFGGTLSDKIGRKKVMLIALFIWSLVFLLFGCVKHPVLFIILNIINGLCNSFFEPVSKALMSDLSDTSERFRIFSLRYLAINIGAAVGPLAGTYLGLVASSTPFLITGTVYFCYALALTLMLRSIVMQQRGEYKEPFRLRIAWDTIKEDVPLRFYVLGGIIWMFGYSQMDSTLIQYLNHEFVEGVKIFSVLITVNAVTVIILQMPITKCFENRNPLFNIAVGNTLFMFGNIGFAFSDGSFSFILSMIVFTLGEILSFPAMNVLLDELAPTSMRGMYYGIQNFYNIGQFLGPWLGGLILGLYGGATLFLIVSFSTLIVLYIYWRGRQKYLASSKHREKHLVV